MSHFQSLPHYPHKPAKEKIGAQDASAKTMADTEKWNKMGT